MGASGPNKKMKKQKNPLFRWPESGNFIYFNKKTGVLQSGPTPLPPFSLPSPPLQKKKKNQLRLVSSDLL